MNHNCKWFEKNKLMTQTAVKRLRGNASRAIEKVERLYNFYPVKRGYKKEPRVALARGALNLRCLVQRHWHSAISLTDDAG